MEKTKLGVSKEDYVKGVMYLFERITLRITRFLLCFLVYLKELQIIYIGNLKIFVRKEIFECEIYKIGRFVRCT